MNTSERTFHEFVSILLKKGQTFLHHRKAAAEVLKLEMSHGS